MANSTTTLPFQLAFATVAGRMHHLSGRNNQDAYAWTQGPGGLIAVVCDGCGSGPHSEVGAQVGARLVAETMALQLAGGGDPAGEDFWQAARASVLETLGGLAGVLGGNPVQAIADYLLFTIVGAVVTGKSARCFSSGDGVIAINGAPTVIGPFEGNAPPYLAYALFEDQAESYQFALQPALPTSELQSLLLGTDGAAELLEVGAAGAFSQLWTDDRVFDNPDYLRRRLFQMARDVPQADFDQRELRIAPGQLGDDTTLIVLRREKGG